MNSTTDMMGFEPGSYWLPLEAETVPVQEPPNTLAYPRAHVVPLDESALFPSSSPTKKLLTIHCFREDNISLNWISLAIQSSMRKGSGRQTLWCTKS
jgi:hypothetical protein